MHDKLLKELKGTSWTVPDGDKFKTFYLEDLFIIDETSLTKEFANQSALYAYFSALSARLEYNLSLISTAKEQSYAEADEYYRAKARHNDEKTTETQIKSQVIRDEEYSKYCDSEAEARRDYKIVQGILRALEQRANMLVSLGSQIRHEANMDGMYLKDAESYSIAKGLKDVIQRRKVDE